MVDGRGAGVDGDHHRRPRGRFGCRAGVGRGPRCRRPTPAGRVLSRPPSHTTPSHRTSGAAASKMGPQTRSGPPIGVLPLLRADGIRTVEGDLVESGRLGGRGETGLVARSAVPGFRSGAGGAAGEHLAAMRPCHCQQVSRSSAARVESNMTCRPSPAADPPGTRAVKLSTRSRAKIR